METSETFLLDKRLEENKAVVRDFYMLAFNQRKPDEAMARFVHTEYCQHNPRVGNGVAAFIAFAKGYLQAYPNLHYYLKRIIAEGDLVMLHSQTAARTDRPGHGRGGYFPPGRRQNRRALGRDPGSAGVFGQQQ